MSEKTGGTVKLNFPFNTAGILEVYMPTLGDWYRVTAGDFRSFDGKRKITQPTGTEHKNVYVGMETYEYFGPVFLYGTNVEVVPSNEGAIVTNEIWEKRLKTSGKRK